jgi:uncharacterized protein YjbI with pentapeptide repeats
MNKILLAFANADEDLPISREAELISKVNNLHTNAQLISLHRANKNNITDQFSKHNDISVFHFSGHVVANQIQLKQFGSIEPFFKDGLTNSLCSLEHLQLVFLNGCNTKTLAEDLIQKGIPNVIVTSIAVKGTLAIQLAIEFYKEFAQNSSIQDSFNIARSIIERNNNANLYKQEIFQKTERGLKLRKTKEAIGFPWKLYQKKDAEDWRIKSSSKPISDFYKKNADSTLIHEKIDETASAANKNDKLKELINQPILLDLITKIDIEIDVSDNRAAIYNKIFDKLSSHSSNDDEKNRYTEAFTPERLIEYISSIAYKIYISDFEYIKKNEIEQLEETKEFVEDCLQIDIEFSPVLKQILVNSCFQNHEKENSFVIDKNNYSIEFMHQSFQEYLVAEYIWTQIKIEFLDKNRRDKYLINSWQKALELIWNLSSHKKTSPEIKDYLVEIIQNDKTKDKKELADRMDLFFTKLLQQQFIWEYKAADNQHSPIEKGITCFYTYWTILSNLEYQIINGKPINRNFITDENRTLFTQIIKITTTNYYQSLSIINQNLEKAILYGLYSPNINIGSSNLRYVDLRYSDLRYANFHYTDLRNTYLSNADLSNTDLRYADLRNADLSEADFRNADLRNADLSKANLRYADLRNADLRNAILSEADLRYADLSEADLRYADLSEAVLNEADLSYVDLRYADLSKANLHEADLRYADLSYADLRYAEVNATLQNADLRNADLRKVILRNADLENAILREADLRNADFHNTVLRNTVLSEAKINRIDWFKFQKNLKQPPIGIDELNIKYKVNPIFIENPYEEDYYTIEERWK